MGVSYYRCILLRKGCFDFHPSKETHFCPFYKHSPLLSTTSLSFLPYCHLVAHPVGNAISSWNNLLTSNIVTQRPFGNTRLTRCFSLIEPSDCEQHSELVWVECFL